MNYGIVHRDGNTNSDGIGIAGGAGAGPEGHDGHVTFYVEVADVEQALAKAESLGGSRVMGPFTVGEQIEIGQFADPEGPSSAWSTPRCRRLFPMLTRRRRKRGSASIGLASRYTAGSEMSA